MAPLVSEDDGIDPDVLECWNEEGERRGTWGPYDQDSHDRGTYWADR